MNIENPLEATKEKLLPLLKESFGENLKSVIMYGSAVTDNFNPESSDINVLVILEKRDTASLTLFGKKSKTAVKKYRFTVLPLAENDFLDSSDVFPMEYNDIHDSHKVVAGENILEKLVITKNNLRHQLEERFRGLVNQICQAVLSCAGDKKILKSELRHIPGITRMLLRSALRLKGVDPKEVPSGRLFAEIKSLYSADFSFVSDFAEKYPGKEAGDVFDFTSELLENLDIVVSEIDSMDR